MTADCADRELEERLRDVGARLQSPPDDADELLKLLGEIEAWLLRVEQSPPESMSSALHPTMSALVKKELLGHPDTDVKVAVASCITEITRITAPDAPYDDDVMKDVFAGIVESFEKLDDMGSRSFIRRVSILDTVAKVRSCVVMLDLECDDLILQMFHHFLKTISSKHPENVICSMETIMKLVIEESEDVQPSIASCLLENVKKEEKETISPSYGLAEKIIGLCHEKLRPVFLQLLQGNPLSEYSKVVKSVCEDSSDAREDKNVNASAKDPADDSKLSERTISDELPQLNQDISHPEQDTTSPNSTPTTAISNGVAPVDNGESNQRPACPKHKPEQLCHDAHATNIDQSKPGKIEVAESVAAKPEKSSDINLKRSDKPDSSSKSEATKHSKVDASKEASVASGELSADTKDGLKQPLNADNGAAGDTSKPVDSMLDIVKPKRGRPPGLKSLEKKAVRKSQASGLDSKRGGGVSDAGGKSIKRPAKDDVKSSTRKTAEGESSKKQQKASLKLQDKTVSEAVSEDTAEDLSLKEMVSPKSSTKVLGKIKGQSGESSGSKRKRGQETEVIPRSRKNKGLDETLVGTRIKVWWPDDKMFYNGIVDSFDTVSKRHKIAYDDGDVEVLTLREEKWEFISGKQENSPGVASEMPRGRKGKGNLGQPVKEAGPETPKSGSDGGDHPKKKGRPKGVRSSNGMPNDDSIVTPSKSKGKSISKDVEDTPKASSNLKKEGGKSAKDKVPRSTGKTKDMSKESGNKDDTTNSGRKNKDGSSKSASKSKDEAGSKGKDSKDESKCSEVTPRGRKPKGASTPAGDESKTNGMSDKEKLKEKGGTSEMDEQVSGKISTGKKRRRKAQS